MTPADELRTAADKLRTLAAAAAEDSGNSNWHATRHFPEVPDSGFTSLWATGVRPLLGGGGGGRAPAYVSAPVGDYIAAVAPGIGSALATWLDAMADWAHAYPEMAHDHERPACEDYACDVMGRGIALARALLGSRDRQEQP